MVCWRTLKTLPCVSKVHHKVRVGYPFLSLPCMNNSCTYFTFQSHFRLLCSNPIQAFNQPFKSTLQRISTVHPQTEMRVYLSSIMLMLVLHRIPALPAAYYPQHPPKEMFTKSVRTPHNQCSFCFLFCFAPCCDENERHQALRNQADTLTDVWSRWF